MAKKPKKICWIVQRDHDGDVYNAYTRDIVISKMADLVWNIELSEDAPNRWSYCIDSPNGFITPYRYAGKTLEEAQASAEKDLMQRVKKIAQELQGWTNG